MQVFLIGFMGSGKSTVGKKLSAALDLPFKDLDSCIENYMGMSIPKIFEEEGEEVFRKYERQVLQQVIKDDGSSVISCGGGTPCFFDNIGVMKEAGTVIYLRAEPDLLHSRLKNSQEARPLIAGRKEKELDLMIQALLAEREEYYLQADIIQEAKSVSGETIQVLAERVIKMKK